MYLHARTGDSECVKLLLQYNSHKTHIDHEGKTPLDEAKVLGGTQILYIY